MNWNMLYLLTANNMTIGESAGYALRMVVVGLGMVFAVLATSVVSKVDTNSA